MTPDQRATMPPAFDMVRRDNTDVSKGYMLRISYADAVIFTYFKQLQPVPDRPNERRNFNQAALVGVPSMYVARMLAVMEGGLQTCQINSRMTRGSFSATGNNTFVLDCVTTVQPGAEPVKWKVEFDVANSVLLQRFLTLSLQHMQGFSL
jgi:hypothetical protein